MKFWELYRIVSRRRLMIATLVAATVAGVYLSTMREKAYYQASVQLMPTESALYHPILPAPKTAAAANIQGEAQTDSQLPNLMSLVKSREVAERTIRVAGLQEAPDSLMPRIDVTTATNPGARTRDQMSTDIMVIQVKDEAPGRAVRTANSLAHVFSNYYQEISHQEATENRRFLESQLERARQELDGAADRLRAFRVSNRLTAPAGAADASTDRVKTAYAERDSARASFAEADARLRQIDLQLSRATPTRTVEESTSDTPMLKQLEDKVAELTVKLGDVRSRYMDSHPQVQAAKDALADAQEKLRHERGQMRRTTTVVRNPVYEDLLGQRSKAAAERDGLAAKASQLESAAARASGELKPGVDVTLTRLDNDFLTASTTYGNLRSQLVQARINEKASTATGAIRIIDEAVAADGPVGVNRAAYLLLGLMLSLVVGSGLAITLDSLDNRIRSNADLERLLGVPATALIPSSTGPDPSALARVTYTDPLSPEAEAYRFLRTDILLSTQMMGCKTIMVATAKPGQGGTSTVANLGISLAQDGRRVVLVDADMRRPCLHRIFETQNDQGLSNVLTGEKEMEDVMLGTEIDNLLLMPAGPLPSNPSELLGSARMKSMVAWLGEHADFVLFDTPSAVAFTDAVVLSQAVDGVLLVVRAYQTPRGTEMQVIDRLRKANANILGAVLNDVAPESVDSYYYHSHYYPSTSKKGGPTDSWAERPSLPPGPHD